MFNVRWRMMTSTDAYPKDSEAGFMAAEWLGAVALLLLPTFIVVVSLLQVPHRQSLAEVTSSEAARAYVQALDESQAETFARAASVDAILAETGRSRDDYPLMTDDEILEELGVTVEVVDDSISYCGGSEFTLRVTVPMPVTLNPFEQNNDLFEVGTLNASATERIDDYAELANVMDFANGLCD